MMLRTLICLLIGALASSALAQPAPSVSPEANVVLEKVGTTDRQQYFERLLSLLEETDPADANSLYEAQQQGMSLAYALFTFGSTQQQYFILAAASKLVQSLPKAGELADRNLIARPLARLELLSPLFTRVRQRIMKLPFSVDGVALPVSGSVRSRRVFPMRAGDQINVLSEAELQFCYLLSTILRLASAKPPPIDYRLVKIRHEALQQLFTFLLQDKVTFYWNEMPSWHWSGPFTNMRERVIAKLEPTQPRLLEPPWYSAILDHEMHLFAIAADLQAVLLNTKSYPTTSNERTMLQEVRSTVVKMLAERVQSGFQDGGGFLFDFGLWSTNPSYAYAGCKSISPLPTEPCPVLMTATDSSHARRWPWWINSFMFSWPEKSTERTKLNWLRRQLARQFASRVLYFDRFDRPLTRNFMDGNDGWYRYRSFNSHPWGHGPSSMTGALRYGSWALLAPLEPKIADAYCRMCEIFVSSDSADIQFRTVYYGAASTRPEMAGLGEKDLYGNGSLYALICRIGQQLELYDLSRKK